MENGKVNENVDNGEDEEEMEKFYALVRNLHEARNRRKEEVNEAQEKGKKNKMRTIDYHHNVQYSRSWVPRFELQDFTEEIEFRKLPVTFPSPSNNKKDDKKQEQEDDGLDLKLTL